MNAHGDGPVVALDTNFDWRSVRLFLFLITPRSISLGAKFLEKKAIKYGDGDTARLAIATID